MSAAPTNYPRLPATARVPRDVLRQIFKHVGKLGDAQHEKVRPANNFENKNPAIEYGRIWVEACTRVCSAWREPAQSVLFERKIIFYLRTQHEFLTLCDEAPTVLRHIRSLDISANADPTEDQPCMTEVLRALRMCRSAVSVSFRLYGDWPHCCCLRTLGRERIRRSDMPFMKTLIIETYDPDVPLSTIRRLLMLLSFVESVALYHRHQPTRDRVHKLHMPSLTSLSYQRLGDEEEVPGKTPYGLAILTNTTLSNVRKLSTYDVPSVAMHPLLSGVNDLRITRPYPQYRFEISSLRMLTNLRRLEVDRDVPVTLLEILTQLPPNVERFKLHTMSMEAFETVPYPFDPALRGRTGKLKLIKMFHVNFDPDQIMLDIARVKKYKLALADMGITLEVRSLEMFDRLPG